MNICTIGLGYVGLVAGIKRSKAIPGVLCLVSLKTEF